MFCLCALLDFKYAPLRSYVVTRTFGKHPNLVKKANRKCTLNVFTTMEDFRVFKKKLLIFQALQQTNKQEQQLWTFGSITLNWPLGFSVYWVTFWNVSLLQQSYRNTSSLITIPLQLSTGWTSVLQAFGLDRLCCWTGLFVLLGWAQKHWLMFFWQTITYSAMKGGVFLSA